MAKRNPSLARLQGGYLFPEIARRRREFQAAHPEVKLISLGIGDTTEPLAPAIVEGIVQGARTLGTAEGYSGYGEEQGRQGLREAIANRFYGGRVAPDEIFISDGAKPDTGRLQMLFGSHTHLAVQDPAYPVYVDSAVIAGQTGEFNKATGTFDGIAYLPCSPENGFFPDLAPARDADVLFFCSPNNPTGAVATRDQLSDLIAFAQQNGLVIVFDAAYSHFIRDPQLPRSIFEIEGAREVAIEINSLSKPAGFTGVRLGWAVVPKELRYSDGGSLFSDYSRVHNTLFNGASNVVEQGALAALSDEGVASMRAGIDYYLANARLIRETLTSLGYGCFGGDNAPYIWTRVEGMSSWEAFAHFLEQAHLVCTPGSGFGPAGEGFVRFSAFGHRWDIEEATHRLREATRG